MIIRFLIPFIAILLFLLEPEFALFSPITMGEETIFLVPRFLILYLIFISVYYSKKRAALYGLFFGVLYDVFYIDIIGLYSVLYPLLCIIAGAIIKSIHQNFIITTILSIVLIAFMEIILYYFFSFIGLTTMMFEVFFVNRLLPTVIANLIFLLLTGWVFVYLLNTRFLQRERSLS